MSDERLRAVEQGQVRIETTLAEFIREQRAANSRLRYFIDGNGEPGVKVRIDRLEQSSNRGRWWMRALTLPVVGILIAKVLEAFGQ